MEKEIAANIFCAGHFHLKLFLWTKEEGNQGMHQRSYNMDGYKKDMKFYLDSNQGTIQNVSWVGNTANEILWFWNHWRFKTNRSLILYKFQLRHLKYFQMYQCCQILHQNLLLNMIIFLNFIIYNSFIYIWALGQFVLKNLLYFFH